MQITWSPSDGVSPLLDVLIDCRHPLIVVQQIRMCQPACLCSSEVSSQTAKWQTCHVCLMALNLICLPCIDRSHWSFVLEINALLEVQHWRRENGSPDCWKTWLKLHPFMDLPDEFLLYLQFLSPTFECVCSWPLEQQFDNDWAKDDKPDVDVLWSKHAD